MCDKRGMILIETLIFYMIVMLMILLLCHCASLWQRIELRGDDFHDEKLQEIYTLS